MGFMIGESGSLSTWLSLRTIVTATIPPPPFPTPASPIFGDHNQEWPASVGRLKTIEGNGLIRIAPPASTPFFDFNDNTPPAQDKFTALNFSDPYPDQLVGRGVTTSGSAFTITVDAFTDPAGQDAGTGGAPPISVEWFTALT